MRAVVALKKIIRLFTLMQCDCVKDSLKTSERLGHANCYRLSATIQRLIMPLAPAVPTIGTAVHMTCNGGCFAL